MVLTHMGCYTLGISRQCLQFCISVHWIVLMYRREHCIMTTVEVPLTNHCNLSVMWAIEGGILQLCNILYLNK